MKIEKETRNETVGRESRQNRRGGSTQKQNERQARRTSGGRRRMNGKGKAGQTWKGVSTAKQTTEKGEREKERRSLKRAEQDQGVQG